MKIVYLLIAFASAIIPCSAISAGTANQILTIDKIVITIDEETYIWNKESPAPLESVTGGTAPLTVISFVKIKPGDKLKIKKLNSEIFKTEQRLNKCKFFYNAVLTSRINDESKNVSIFIDVEDGYLYRFGGGNAYGMFGKDNISGKRKSFRLYAGYNLAGASYDDYMLFDSDATAGISSFYKKSDSEMTSVKYNAFDTSLRLGYRITPEIDISSSMTHRYININSMSVKALTEENSELKQRIYLSPEISVKSYSPGLWGIFEYGFTSSFEKIYPLKEMKTNAQRYNLKTSFGNGNERLSFNIQLLSGFSSGKLLYSDKFDLFSTPDGSIRSGYYPDELTVKNYIMSSFEIRFGIYEAMLASLIDFKTAGFLFSDIAYTSDYRTEIIDGKIKDAYGAGIRLKFENPVYAYFTFSYGINRFGCKRFILTGTAGF